MMVKYNSTIGRGAESGLAVPSHPGNQTLKEDVLSTSCIAG